MPKPRKPFLHHLHDYFFPHPRNDHRPHLFSAASVAGLALAVIVLEGAYLVQTKLVFPKTDFLASILPGALVALTNQDRAAHGLAGVTEDPVLDAAARAAALDMATKGYFAHVSPEGKTPWQWLDEAGYRYGYAGQNLAVDFSDSQYVEKAWMDSPTHKANIVKREYTRVGFGTASGVYQGRATTFVVEFFATPIATAASAPLAEVKPPQPPERRGKSSVDSATVLGSQARDSDHFGAAAAAAPAPGQPSWFAQLLASPLNTLTAILSLLFTGIATSFAITILVRGRSQHRSVLVGGTLLLAIISGALLVSSQLAGRVKLPGEAFSVSTNVVP